MENLEKLQMMEVHDLHTSNRNCKYLIDYQDRHFEVGRHLAMLISTFKTATSLKDITLAFSEKCKHPYSEDEVQELLIKHVKPIIDAENTKVKKPLLFSVELLSAKSIDKFSRVLKCFFNPVAAIAIAGLILISEIMFFTYTDLNIKVENISAYVILGVFIRLLYYIYVLHFSMN